MGEYDHPRGTRDLTWIAGDRPVTSDQIMEVDKYWDEAHRAFIRAQFWPSLDDRVARKLIASKEAQIARKLKEEAFWDSFTQSYSP